MGMEGAVEGAEGTAGDMSETFDPGAHRPAIDSYAEDEMNQPQIKATQWGPQCIQLRRRKMPPKPGSQSLYFTLASIGPRTVMPSSWEALTRDATITSTI